MFGNASGRKIYVPRNSVEAYKAAQYWSEYADYIFPDASESTNNKIFYTSSDGAVVTPYATDVFGANIVSNTYENGQGVITVDGDITSIGDWAFCRCTSLTSVTIGNSVTSIGNGAFSGCSSLNAFYGKFASLDNRCLIVDGVLHSFASAGVTEYTIPNGVTSIGAWAFSDCYRLTSVTIPDSVTSIEYEAFYKCTSLTAFYGKFASLDNRCLILDGVLNSFAPAGLTEYTIPDSVTLIGRYSFYECTSLTSVTIPDSVTEIGNHAFWGCIALSKVYCKPITPPVTNVSMFSYNHSSRKFYVPRNSVEKYKSIWRTYAYDIEGYDF